MKIMLLTIKATSSIISLNERLNFALANVASSGGSIFNSAAIYSPKSVHASFGCESAVLNEWSASTAISFRSKFLDAVDNVVHFRLRFCTDENGEIVADSSNSPSIDSSVVADFCRNKIVSDKHIHMYTNNYIILKFISKCFQYLPVPWMKLIA